MADERTTAVRRQTGQAALRPAAAAMTPKEVLGVLRRHMLLIILLTRSPIIRFPYFIDCVR